MIRQKGYPFRVSLFLWTIIRPSVNYNKPLLRHAANRLPVACKAGFSVIFPPRLQISTDFSRSENSVFKSGCRSSYQQIVDNLSKPSKLFAKTMLPSSKNLISFSKKGRFLFPNRCPAFLKRGYAFSKEGRPVLQRLFLVTAVSKFIHNEE